MRLACLALAIAGCSPSGPLDCAAGVEPVLAGCIVGAAVADCGGTGPAPVLACSTADRACRWFAGGCIAYGYFASPCAAADVCCFADFPFEGALRSEPWVAEFVYAFGTAPWDPARGLALTAAIDPALAGAPASLTCTGAIDDGNGPCSGAAVQLGRSGALLVQFLPGGGMLAGWSLSVDVIRRPDGTYAARACRIPFTSTPTPSCTAAMGPTCATSGAVTLSEWPTTDVALGTLRGALTADFGALGSVTGRF